VTPPTVPTILSWPRKIPLPSLARRKRLSCKGKSRPYCTYWTVSQGNDQAAYRPMRVHNAGRSSYSYFDKRRELKDRWSVSPEIGAIDKYASYKKLIAYDWLGSFLTSIRQMGWKKQTIKEGESTSAKSHLYDDRMRRQSERLFQSVFFFKKKRRAAAPKGSVRYRP